jgi:hypothetical protein
LALAVLRPAPNSAQNKGGLRLTPGPMCLADDLN